jgi:hypothetical protein
MGYDHHFLSRLERLDDPRQLEAAKRLYNRSEILQLVLEKAELPAECERVAISLSHPVDGPWIITTRDGQFVTCLGAGMRPYPDQPRVMPEVLKNVMAVEAQSRRYVEAFAGYVSRSGTPRDEALLGWVLKMPARVTLEDAHALAGLSILAPHVVMDVLLDVRQRANRCHRGLVAARGRRGTLRHLDDLQDAFASAAHFLASLNAGDEPTVRVASDFLRSQAKAFAVQSTPVAVRGLWSLRHMPELYSKCKGDLAVSKDREAAGVTLVVGMVALLADEHMSTRRRLDSLGELLDAAPPGFSTSEMADIARTTILRPEESVCRAAAAGRTLYAKRSETLDSGRLLRVANPLDIPEQTALATLYSIRSDAAPFTIDHLPTVLAAMPHFLRAPLGSLCLPARTLDALQRG